MGVCTSALHYYLCVCTLFMILMIKESFEDLNDVVSYHVFLGEGRVTSACRSGAAG